MKFIPYAKYATYLDLLQFTGLYQHYTRYVDFYREASALFTEGKKRAAFDIINQMWLDPHIVPALILGECYKMGTLLVPAWNSFPKYILVNQAKSDGSTRPIIVPHLETRVTMGVVNSMLQSSCDSWTSRTHGFRAPTHKFQDPNPDLPRVAPLRFGTKSLLTAVNQETRDRLLFKSSTTLVFFDIKKAFNSVDLHRLFNTLELHQLPKDIKYLIWQWQHTKVLNAASASVQGLAQGFPYSPTLFAWYLDAIFLNTFGQLKAGRPDFFIYADNVVGLFDSVSDAQRALTLLNAALVDAGLKINQASVNVVTVNNSSMSFDVSWLGHKLLLPDCNVDFNVYNVQTSTPILKRPTKKEWFNLLSTTDWKRKVYAQNWRFIKT